MNTEADYGVCAICGKPFDLQSSNCGLWPERYGFSTYVHLKCGIQQAINEIPQMLSAWAGWQNV
jgi:hypothetical protein